MAVSGQASFRSRLMIRAMSRCHTPSLQNADRSENEDWDSFSCSPSNPLLSAHFWAPAGAGTIVLTALSSSVTEGNYTQKWNDSACRRKTCMRACTCVRFICVLVIVCSTHMNQCTSVLVRKYADSEKLAPLILFLQQSVHHCFNHKSLRINPQWPYCRAERGFLSQWLTVIIIEREWAEVLSNVQKLCLHAS